MGGKGGEVGGTGTFEHGSLESEGAANHIVNMRCGKGVLGCIVAIKCCFRLKEISIIDENS